MPSGVFPLIQSGGVGSVSGMVQLPEKHTDLPQKSSPVPQAPSRLQQSPHLPAHSRLPWSGPQVPSVLYTLSPAQAPS